MYWLYRRIFLRAFRYVRRQYQRLTTPQRITPRRQAALSAVEQLESREGPSSVAGAITGALTGVPVEPMLALNDLNSIFGVRTAHVGAFNPASSAPPPPNSISLKPNRDAAIEPWVAPVRDVKPSETNTATATNSFGGRWFTSSINVSGLDDEFLIGSAVSQSFNGGGFVAAAVTVGTAVTLGSTSGSSGFSSSRSEGTNTAAAAISATPILGADTSPPLFPAPTVSPAPRQANVVAQAAPVAAAPTLAPVTASTTPAASVSASASVTAPITSTTAKANTTATANITTPATTTATTSTTATTNTTVPTGTTATTSTTAQLVVPTPTPTAPPASASPSSVSTMAVANTYVNFLWNLLPAGTPVVFLGDLSTHTVGTDAFGTITAALANVTAGGNLFVDPGVYIEQLAIDKDVQIFGTTLLHPTLQTVLKTEILSPTSLTSNAVTGDAAIIDIGNDANVTLRNLTISGPGPNPNGTLDYGIFVGGNAHLDIADSHVTRIRDLVFSGTQSGNAIRVGAQFANQVATATIDNVIIDDYQKGGIIIDGAGSSATITGNTVTGAGQTGVIAQNGIQISRGATATITGNTISNNFYTGTDTIAVGILFFQAGAGATQSGNTFSGNQIDFLDSTTTTTLDSTLDPIGPVGTLITFTATVSSPTPGAHFDGTYTFCVNGVDVTGPLALDANYSATYTTDDLPVGEHIVTAKYSGDLCFEPSETSITVTIFEPPPSITDCGCDCPATSGTSTTPGSLTATITTPTNARGNSPGQSSGEPVRYFDGVVTIKLPGLGSDGFGIPWGQSLSWSNGPGYSTQSVNGFGMVDAQMPYLLPVDVYNEVVLITNGTSARYYDLVSGSYQSRFFDQNKLVYDSGNKQFVLTDASGNTIRFYDFDKSLTDQQKGSFKSYTDQKGNVTSVTSHTSTGEIAEVRRSSTVGSTTVTESFVYTYLTSGANKGLLSNLTERRQTNSGAWTTVRQIDYTYYDGTTDTHGNKGDLKLLVIKDGAGNTLDTAYMRYYTTEAGGYQHGLKYRFGSESYSRLTTALGTGLASLTDAQVSQFADQYLEFDSAKRVTKEVVQGAGCSSCSDGLGTYTFSYTKSSNPDDFNKWNTKTVETFVDAGNDALWSNTVFTNAYGSVMLKVHTDTSSGLQWKEFYEYDSAGRAVLMAAPSAVTGFDETKADLLNEIGGNYQYLSDTDGLITLYGYYTTTTATETVAGGVAGYDHTVKISHGELGTPITQETMDYFRRTVGNAAINPVAHRTVYRNEDGTGAQTTSMSYTWYAGTTQMESMTVSLPVVTAAQNGPGTADVSTTHFDLYGRVQWQKDGDGFITFTSYDQSSGGVVKMIADVDTTQTGDFADLPSGWVTSAGGGLHLITTSEVDSIGRPTKMTHPNGNVDYMRYNDVSHEVRVYRGWNATTHTPTGPIEVTREDRPGSYTETLTMSAAPALDASNLPTGTEAISNIESLTRTHTTAGGQVDTVDEYFDLTGITYSTATLALGTEGTNFYRMRYRYNDQGLVNRVVSPQGTITRTEYDDQKRAISIWVGTNDTPSSGFWSPTNNTGTANMVKVGEYEYDGGGVGDNNLTKSTEIPDQDDLLKNRVTQTWFDWRNRAVAVKSGVGVDESTSMSVNRPLVYSDYDNLNQVTKTRVYDADNVTPTMTAGVPQPLIASLLRAQSTAEFDEHGRAFRSHMFSVDPTNGTISTTSLTSDTFFDHRGQVIKSSVPGGLVSKVQYDGVSRMTVSSLTDGGGDSGWSDADDVVGDIVLEQSEPTYDANSNVLFTTSRARFHDTTGTGALGTPTSGIAARVSFTANYYDLADRLTAMADFGTNGGAAFTRPATVPARSDVVLVTGYTFDDAGRLKDVTDPAGRVHRKEYDALGRTTKTIENYLDGVVSDGDDKTTTFAFNRAGMTTLTAHLTGGGVQTTQWVFGVTTGTGSTISSNDIVGKTQFPDATTGAPSSSEQEITTVNALGQMLTYIDRNGSTHALTYDVLGRVVSDAVTALGSGVNDAVRRIDTAFDGQGNAFLITSYDAATGGGIVNQVQREFNGLGQMTKEYLSHNGAVNTATTPFVQYTYSDMTGGGNHSRLTKITYPSGYELNFNYSSGLNSSISRLSSLSDSTGTLESYDYLGLATVVRRAHPQPNVDLTYIKLAGELNGDAGDQYTGLDRFGRVVDQRWLNPTTSTTLERLQYGYDEVGNRLCRDNLVNTTFGELYTYDDLNQLASFDRGTLNGTRTGMTGTVAQSQDWDYDALGNWNSVTTNTTTQTRGHNKQNEITIVSGATSPTFDSNGNMTTDETGKQFVYDAWNRLVMVKNSGGTTLKTYAYDGLTRRVTETVGSTTTDLFYSVAWQVLEEKIGANTTKRYVWSPVYVDAMILRDRDTNNDGTLDERLWVIQDANFNVTALVNGSGTVVERYVYTPFGTRTVYDPNWNVLAGSAYDFGQGFQGMFFDMTSGLNISRARPGYSPTLGRWVTMDPTRYSAGDVNLYGFVSENPTNRLDPSGLEEFDHTKLKPNWNLATGRIYHHIDQVEITLKNCKDKDALQKQADGLFDNMKQFRDFNHPDNLASIRIYKDGYAAFEANGFAGWAARRISGDGPDNLHFVKLTTGVQGPAKILSAVTLGSHVLVGVRTWHVFVSGNKIVVGTETFDQRSSNAADKGFSGPDIAEAKLDGLGLKGPMKGPNDTAKIWRQYLKNIAEVITERQTIGSYEFTKGMPVSEFPQFLGGDPFAQKNWRDLTQGLMPGPLMGRALAKGENPFKEKWGK